MSYLELPAELTPINIKAYLTNNLGLCCTANTSNYIKEITRIMEWLDTGPHSDKERCNYKEVFPDTGIYYIIVGLMDNIDLCDHGSSIRYPWLSTDGERLIAALRKTDPEQIDKAKGEGYDGYYYD